MLNTAMKTQTELPRPIANQTFLQDVLAGLAHHQKRLSPKYFYDTKGSEYFDEICDLDEYYPYKTELRLLPIVAQALRDCFKEPLRIVEFGAGALKKVQPLLRVLPVESFLPIDISGEFLEDSCAGLRKRFPNVDIQPINADFCEAVSIPKLPRTPTLGFFPGSTIGNFPPEQAITFLKNARCTLGEGQYLLIGVDTKKSPNVLHQAYNDAEQVTAKFNLNVLDRINAELNANFNTAAFEHYAFYNTHRGCIEMHLVSTQEQTVQVANHRFRFAKGESIHTESSYKYNTEDFKALAAQAGWHTEASWLGDDALFSMHLLKA